MINRKKGHRIRASDKSLVFRFSACSLSGIYVMTVILLNLKHIILTDWTTYQFIRDIKITPYMIFSIVIALLLCVITSYLYYKFRFDKLKQMKHRQKLARMILENGWYESEKTENSGYFKDLPFRENKEKITYFPKIYYRMENGLLYIQAEISLGKYQEQLLNLEKKLESGLFCELTEKELHESYVEYTLFYDMIANRIPITDVKVENGKMKLMKNIFWEYDTLPHMLIAGGTGGGKTYFILTIIEALLETNAKISVLDPKNADLADLETVLPEVYYRKEDIIDCIYRFYENMMKRSESMKQMNGYKTGENYS